MIVVIALLVGLSLPAMADSQVRDSLIYNSVNMTANKITKALPTTSSIGDRAYLAPGKHRIIKYEVSGMTANASGAAGIPIGSTSREVVCSIYDAASIGAATNKTLEGELESNDADTVFKAFDRPMKLVNGLVIVQGAWTVVTIEYERLNP